MTDRPRLILFSTIWLLAMAMIAFGIESHLFRASAKSYSKDPLYLLLGSAKEAIGDTFFLKASSYFHGGVNSELIQCEEALGKREGSETAAHTHETYKKSYTDWVYQINSQVKAMEDRHLDGQETSEILPFLKAAVTLDPYNVPAVLTTAYWLNDHFKKTDAAIEVLRQGLKDNPDSWEIAYQLGLSYLKSKKDYSKSTVYFAGSLKKMNADNSTAIDRRTAYYYLGEAYAEQGLKNEAIRVYQKALSYFNESENLAVRTRIISKIQALSKS